MFRLTELNLVLDVFKKYDIDTIKKKWQKEKIARG